MLCPLLTAGEHGSPEWFSFGPAALGACRDIRLFVGGPDAANVGGSQDGLTALQVSARLAVSVSPTSEGNALRDGRDDLGGSRLDIEDRGGGPSQAWQSRPARSNRRDALFGPVSDRWLGNRSTRASKPATQDSTAKQSPCMGMRR